jgi:peptide deformylase
MSNKLFGKARARQRKKEFIKKKLHRESATRKILSTILKYDHPALKTICEPISSTDDLDFINDMQSVLKASVKGIGLSANQIGVTKRVIVVDFNKNNKFTTMINPTYEIIKETDVDTKEEIIKMFEYEEGCLSYPGMFKKNSRPRKILVKYYDENRKEAKMECSNLESTLVQHETDHLDGKCLFFDIWKRKQERDKIIYFQK